jgi:RNA polymerase sigma factor (sigma-70 family)
MATTLATEPQELFEQLYERYVQDVYRYALALLRNPADAEDVTQTTFMNAYRAMKRGERPEKPHHWLIVIAHNACRTRASRAARRPREVPLDETVQQVPIPEAERPNLRAVLDALGRLPFNQRSALVMRELEGRTYEEIAETLGVTVAAVETLIFRARRSLRLRRDAFRSLAVVQAPASLATFGGAVASGGGILLGGAGIKAAALVAAVVAGGAAYEAVATAPPASRHARGATTQILLAAGLPGGAVAHAQASVHGRVRPHRATLHRRSGMPLGGGTGAVAGTAVPGAVPAPAPQPAGAAGAGGGTRPAATTTVGTATQTVTTAPTLPAAPSLPPPPAVTTPPLPPATVPLPTTTVAVTVPTATVTTPQLP